MEKKNYTATIEVAKSPQEVFNCLKEVSKWWSKDFKGNSTKLNDEFVINHPDRHYSKQKLIMTERVARTHNMGFSAMLADEYILIDISLIGYSPGLTNKAELQNIFSSSLTLLSNGSSFSDHGSTAESPAR